jgi:hypothetical protein
LFFPYTPLATVNVEAAVNKDEPEFLKFDPSCPTLPYNQK